MEVNLNVKKLDARSEILGTQKSLLAPGAISIHRPGLEAALLEPLQDLAFRESNI